MVKMVGMEPALTRSQGKFPTCSPGPPQLPLVGKYPYIPIKRWFEVENFRFAQSAHRGRHPYVPHETRRGISPAPHGAKRRRTLSPGFDSI